MNCSLSPANNGCPDAQFEVIVFLHLAKMIIQ